VLVFAMLLMLILSAVPAAMAGGLETTPKPDSLIAHGSAAPAAATPSGSIVQGSVQQTSGTVSSSPYQVTISGFTAGTQGGRLLVVGISANNENASSVAFGSAPLKKVASSFHNNDAEFWYLPDPTGTGDIVVTMAGPTSVVAGAYLLSGVDLTNPIPTATRSHARASSPTITLTTASPNSWVLDLPSIWGGVTLGSSSSTPQWDVNVPGGITGASGSLAVSTPSQVTASWTASGGGDAWDDVAIEVKGTTPPAYSGGPVFVWLFGYTGDSFLPEAQLGITQDTLVNVTKNLAATFGKDNLRVVTAVNQIRGSLITPDGVPAIKSYVDSLGEYASVVYGRMDMTMFNLGTTPSVYDEFSLYVNQLDLNGVWVEKAAVYYGQVGQGTFNDMMQNLTTAYPSVQFLLNQAAVKFGIVTPTNGTTWSSMAWITPSLSQNSTNFISLKWVQQLDAVYPGRVVVHWDSDPKVAAQPMGLFASETQAQEISDFSIVWTNVATVGARAIIPVIGSWTCACSDYGGTLYNSLQVGAFSRGTSPYFIQIALGHTSRLTVLTESTAGAALTGFWTQLYMGGVTAAAGYTPANFTLIDGQMYTLEADGYGGCTFDHWQDTGNISNQRDIATSEDVSLTAVLNCGP